mmetsp:Transcript_5930/g.11881  ORF Transcript_5930/g.11881 Transcript_5930/m.11881 type:complete len:205 (-) Transcript_5930:384-998(-)
MPPPIPNMPAMRPAPPHMIGYTIVALGVHLTSPLRNLNPDSNFWWCFFTRLRRTRNTTTPTRGIFDTVHNQYAVLPHSEVVRRIDNTMTVKNTPPTPAIFHHGGNFASFKRMSSRTALGFSPITVSSASMPGMATSCSSSSFSSKSRSSFFSSWTAPTSVSLSSYSVLSNSDLSILRSSVCPVDGVISRESTSSIEFKWPIAAS